MQEASRPIAHVTFLAGLLYQALAALRRLAALGSLTLALASCASLSGSPKPTMEAYEAETAGSDCDDCRPSLTTLVNEGTPSQEDRDAYINREVIKIDQAHDAFVRALRKDKTGLDLGNKLLNLIFNVATTLTDSSGVQKNYAAAGLLVSGTYEAIDKTAFSERTVAAIIAAMDAQRTKVLVRIRQGMAQDPGAYPLFMAHRDLVDYQLAGTVNEGLSFIENASAAQSERSKADIQRIAELAPKDRQTRYCVTRSLESGNWSRTLDNLKIAASRLGFDPSVQTESADQIADKLRVENRKSSERSIEVAAALEATNILLKPCPEY